MWLHIEAKTVQSEYVVIVVSGNCKFENGVICFYLQCFVGRFAQEAPTVTITYIDQITCTSRQGNWICFYLQCFVGRRFAQEAPNVTIPCIDQITCTSTICQSHVLLRSTKSLKVIIYVLFHRNPYLHLTWCHSVVSSISRDFRPVDHIPCWYPYPTGTGTEARL